MSANTPKQTKQLVTWLIFFAALAISFAIDGRVMAWVEPLPNSRIADFIHNTIRWLGTGYIQVPTALIMLAIGGARSKRLKRAGGWTLLSFIIAGAAVNILKPIIHRARPYTTDPRPDNWVGYLQDSAFQSFPSAESATTFAVALTLIGWYPKLRWPLLIIAGCVGVGRVLVGGHHPSDVVAGAMLGAAVAQVLLARACKLEHIKHERS